MANFRKVKVKHPQCGFNCEICMRYLPFTVVRVTDSGGQTWLCEDCALKLKDKVKEGRLYRGYTCERCGYYVFQGDAVEVALPDTDRLALMHATCAAVKAGHGEVRV